MPKDSRQQKSVKSRESAPKRRPCLLAEFRLFLKYNKKWWLWPIIIVLLLVGALILLGGTAISPFIYPFF